MGYIWVNNKQDEMFTITFEGRKGHNLHQARGKEIQFHCVYHSRILMSGVNVLQLNHIHRQTVCEMNVKGAIHLILRGTLVKMIIRVTSGVIVEVTVN